MKYTFTIFLMLLIWNTTTAQLQLEETYNHSGTLVEIDENEFKYYFMDVPLNQCRIYNEDHSLFKTIDLNIPSGYFLYDIKFLSRRIFNSDDNIELLYIYNKSETVNTETVYSYGLKIVNENGIPLLELSNGGYAEILEGSDGLKLLAYQYIWYNTYYLIYTNVYSISGSSGTTLTAIEPEIRIYPNPTSENINVELNSGLNYTNGNILIHDISGKKLLSSPLPVPGETAQISTDMLPSGTYILNVITDSRTRISNKFIKD
ncbi:MAG: T9SS type A sorting domain-containing protein [Bacteroidales bacterium]|nr:T9SS type A sorting domain-containing protein [Bacteroidales bacterium]